MPAKKKPAQKPLAEPNQSAQIVTPAAHDFFSKGDEPWRKWNVKPQLSPITASPPESGIGNRIAYCRFQLDNLSVDALARYTKGFDSEGISRMSIVRYESGASPGARELRILADVLWVPISWLVLGFAEGPTQAESKFRAALREMLIEMHVIDLPLGVIDLEAASVKDEIARRQKLIHEARNPSKT